MSSSSSGTRVTVLPHPERCPGGTSFDAPAGMTLVDALLQHGVAIEHDCGKVGACATCHVYLRDGAGHLAPADDDEREQLADAWAPQAASRLSCRVTLAGPALVVELPRHA